MKLTDSEFIASAVAYAQAWFRMSIDDMPAPTKARFLQYLGKKLRLRVPQVARCLRMERQTVADMIGRRR